MKIEKRERDEVVQCVHCEGTGLCRQSSFNTNHQHQWLECPDCGKGIPCVVGDEFNDEHQRPVCAVCGGKGYVGSKRAAAHAVAA